jgi:hypothetical protein
MLVGWGNDPGKASEGNSMLAIWLTEQIALHCATDWFAFMAWEMLGTIDNKAMAIKATSMPSLLFRQFRII